MKANNLACPIDTQRLVLHDRQLRCANGHSFDLARQGYVNLLPVQHKRSKHPGDSKAMVAARQRFLDTAVYAPVADLLATTLGAAIAGIERPCCLDAGCGEGYYLDYAATYLEAVEPACEPELIGLDISKDAIIAAARRNKTISWLVGTNRQPPLVGSSVDVILCVFGFHSFQGFNKIMSLGGKLILVEPGPDHLQELRQATYAELKKTSLGRLDEAFALGFKQVGEQALRYETPALSKQVLADLLLMTPHFFRATQEGRQAAAQLDEVSLTVDVVFRSLEKIADHDRDPEAGQTPAVV
ncbi:MAG: methyltransferase domain-containing protein [Porticoccaceae bacterium]|nr:methyltransferase domain-containing protein [Porticoccaceae bacterium]